MPWWPARLALLDGFALACGDVPRELPRSLQRLLAFLALRGKATRAHVVGALWPEVTEHRALASLRTTLWRLHQLSAPVVVARGETLSLHEQVRVDVADLVWSARLVLADGANPKVTTLILDGLRELLPGWYDDWVLTERERLRQLHLHALEHLAAHSLRSARYADAVEAALAAIRAEPLRESPHRLLVEIHLAEGNHVEALNAYHSCQRLLRRELGIGPSAGMRMLLGKLGNGDEAAECIRQASAAL